jgi:tetratricopeptide (TPR) repeat protein
VERPELKLVTAGAAGPGWSAATGLGAVVLAFSCLATMFGADAARAPFDPIRLAESGLAKTLATGDPEPAAEARSLLESRLRRNPLDTASRTIAASLLVETATTKEQRDAAVDQAEAAVRLTPSDASVAHRTSRILARCGRNDLALLEVSRMFAYAPPAAAATLADIEPFVAVDRLEDAIPPLPGAWLAWSVKLRANGREHEADARLKALLARWPGDLEALRVAASVAAGRDRADEVARLVPATLALPATAEAAELYAFRARSKSAAGDAAGAHADARNAIALSDESPWVVARAGDAFAESEPALAREYWTRALYRLQAKPETRGVSIYLRYRLARLDDREGRAGDALREWRTILADRPDDGEAKRRVAALTGESAP